MHRNLICLVSRRILDMSKIFSAILLEFLVTFFCLYSTSGTSTLNTCCAIYRVEYVLRQNLYKCFNYSGSFMKEKPTLHRVGGKHSGEFVFAEIHVIVYLTQFLVWYLIGKMFLYLYWLLISLVASHINFKKLFEWGLEW